MSFQKYVEGIDVIIQRHHPDAAVALSQSPYSIPRSGVDLARPRVGSIVGVT
jgi:hypothetical protein